MSLRSILVIGVALLLPAGGVQAQSTPPVPAKDSGTPAHAAQLQQGVVSPSASTAPQAAVGSAFTYQGVLKSGGSVVTGTYDFSFRLFDDSAAGSQIATTQTVLGVSVDNGLFAVPLDFGAAAFDGNERWLDIQVRVQGGGSYTQLLPRTALRPVPYATRSMNGPTGSSQWANDTYGITYANKVGVGTPTNPTAKMWVDSGSSNNNTLYLTSTNGPWAVLGIRNYGTNGWGLYDDTSARHYLFGDLGIGQTNPGYPLDIQNNVGSGIRIAATGTTLAAGYPGEGVRAALFVHGYTGSGAFGATSGGIYSSSTDSRAVSGWSTNDWGVDGNNTTSGCYGVLGTLNEGVFGYSPNAAKPAAKFNCVSGGVAVEANGLVKVKTLQILGGADLAEPFDVTHAADATPEPGAVVVIDNAHPGDLAVSTAAYDTRVAGVISGANDLEPGMVMRSEQEHAHGDHPVALTGRVWCKVDASFGPVHPGDLLVSSPTPGHAMVARDAARRQGAVLGKAMTSLEAGRGLVLVLVSLQ